MASHHILILPRAEEEIWIPLEDAEVVRQKTSSIEADTMKVLN
jgi:hypothetical protein